MIGGQRPTQLQFSLHHCRTCTGERGSGWAFRILHFAFCILLCAFRLASDSLLLWRSLLFSTAGQVFFFFFANGGAGWPPYEFGHSQRKLGPYPTHNNEESSFFFLHCSSFLFRHCCPVFGLTRPPSRFLSIALWWPVPGLL